MGSCQLSCCLTLTCFRQEDMEVADAELPLDSELACSPVWLSAWLAFIFALSDAPDSMVAESLDNLEPVLHHSGSNMMSLFPEYLSRGCDRPGHIVRKCRGRRFPYHPIASEPRHPSQLYTCLARVLDDAAKKI
jgi:hypothetical protein